MWGRCHAASAGPYSRASFRNLTVSLGRNAAQIVFETFLEDVNNILTSGEVPNLFPKDELGPLLDEVRRVGGGEWGGGGRIGRAHQ